MKKCVFGLVVVAAVMAVGINAYAAKATIGLVPFKDKVGVSKSITDALSDMMTTSLAKSKKFDVVERTALGDIAAEQMFGASGAVDAESAAEMGKLKGADYILLGVVTEAGSSKNSAGAYGVNVKKSTVSLAVDIRFVDSTSGSVMFAETFKTSRSAMGIGSGSSSFDINSDVGSEMARTVIDSITQKTLFSVYPPKVIKSDGEKVTINYGDVMFAAGDVLDLMSQGEELIDPDTGESLGSDEEKIGQIEIVSTTSALSIGRLVSGEAVSGAVCRKVVSKPKKQGKRKKLNPFK